MLTDDFDFELPEAAIAQQPVARGSSRLLVVDEAARERRHRRVSDLADLLLPGDLLVVNDTRVIPARLFARRAATGARIELLLIEKVDDTLWDVLARPGRKARPGTRLELAEGLEGRTESRPDSDDGRLRVRFSQPVEPFLEKLGHIPLPPYIKRPDNAADRERYQTVFAAKAGAVAAPTAGLHFDDALLAALEARGVERATVTLHVGIGTFKPVTADLVHEHRMESERFEIPATTARALHRTRQRGGRVVAVGTTVVRTLEGAARQGLESGSGRTDLFITPGFQFQRVDLLLTNFHLPKSTLLMLVSAFGGRRRMLAAYREAIAEGYRFYSYGDAMLLARADAATAESPPSGNSNQEKRVTSED
ncbi:MAG: tRNA preQ1(34) S-adenosylmethionine ribosyltransferase-isomerase QueA [Acidobacteriota bacterium]